MAITVSELKSEFGTYIQTNMKTILKALMQPTETMKFMTTVASKNLEWRAAQAAINDVVQGFQKQWTAKGTATFTPISIPQRRHKVDMEFYPDDVFESWLGFLTDEAVDRKQWPITRYIIDQLLIPKVNDNRELQLIGKGDYEAPVDGVAQATGKSMDGFATILEDKKTAGTSNINFFDGGDVGAPTSSNIVDFIDAFVDFIDYLYQGIQMPILTSPAWERAYRRKYRDLYGANTDFDGNTGVALESNNRLIGVPSLSGKNVFMVTPKNNFFRLLNSNEGASNIFVESIDRKVKVFADWHESVGFGVEEAIFAYVPEGSGSGSGA